MIGQETSKQSSVRSKIEEIFEDIFISHLVSPGGGGRPDGLSVAFDENGGLIIEKIIESKISLHAAKVSRCQRQPESQCKTLTNLVRAINQIISNKKISPAELTSKQKLSKKEKTTLNKLICLINSLHLEKNERIGISPQLTYETIVCDAFQNPHERKFVRNVNDSETKIFVTKSIFSKSDLDLITGNS